MIYIYTANYIYIRAMDKLAAYIRICTLAMVCLCTATTKVNFKLSNEKEALRCTVPAGAFRGIDDLEKRSRPSPALRQGSPGTEEECEIFLSYIHTPQQYEHFKAFWKTDLTDLPAYLVEGDKALSLHRQDLTPGVFDSFLFTASRLNIQGKHAKRFAKNMVRYGLLGKHSKDITEFSLAQDEQLAYDTLHPMLLAFLDQTGLEHRTIVHSSAEKTVLFIEKVDAWPKQIEYDYTAPYQTARIRTVLYSRLGPRGSQEKERNEAVLSWLLALLGGSSVDIQYSTSLFSEGIAETKKTIQNFTKEGKKDARVYVEGVTIDVDYNNNTSLRSALQLVPELSCLKLFITSIFIPNTSLPSLFSSITSCKSLKSLKIVGRLLDSVAISRLVESLPTIEQLSLSYTILEDTVIDNLKKCACLESLEIYGEEQPSAVVQALVSHLPFLKALSIKCKVLEPAAVDSFEACTQLEKLEVWGEDQPSTVVQALAKRLSFLKELDIWCGVLEPAATDSFEVCTQLEKLNIVGELQPSTVVQALVKSLPLLKEITIKCQDLDSIAAESFKACLQLEKLNMAGKESVSFLAKLLEALPSLQELRIEIATAELALADALRKHPNLRSLRLKVRQFNPDFLAYYLRSPFPKLETLKLYKLDKNTKYSKNDGKAILKARARGIQIFLFVILS
ncbi:hypothetical protein NECID01_2087 [Nematocida sp. AWRm77]|nr:hypothetical protein NECID01_2087 [Nematocida sp. AWRm77]